MLVAGMGLAQLGWSQVVIGGWDTSTLPGGTNNFGPSPFTATATATNTTVGGLTRGSGVSTTGSAAARAWGGVNWNSTQAGGISGNQFITFTVKANASYTLSLSSINPFNYRRSSTGPSSGALQYSINGGTYTAIATVSFPSTSSSGSSVASTDLSGITALQNLPSTSTVTFRLVPYGASNAGGTFYIFDVANSTANDFAVNGVVSCEAITFTGTPTDACPASSNGQIAVSGVTGGTGPYMYSKDNGTSYQPGATFTGLAANTYQVVVKDNNGCTSGATAVIVGTATPPTCSITGEEFICNNSTGNVYTAPAGMSAYSWGISGAGSIPGSTTGQSVSVTASNLLGGNYTVSVTITNANGCTSSCSKQSYIVFSAPPADITINPNPACFGVILDLSIASHSSSTVSWTGEGIVNTGGNFIPNNNPFYDFNNVTTAIPTTTGPHTYTVTVTSSFYYGGCSNTGTATVNILPAPPTCSISGASAVCANSAGNVYAAPGGVSAYSWSVGGNGSIVGSATGSSVIVTAGASGSYTVSVTLTDDNGCTSTCSQPVTVNALPSATIIGPPPSPGPSNDTLCTDQQYVFTGPAGMSAYQWSVTSNGTINGSNTGSSVTITPNSGSSMTVYVTVTDANGCINTSSYSRYVQASPTCSVSGPLNVCGGSTGNVYTVNSNAQYYVWSISGDGMITSSPTTGYNITSVTVTAGASGTYTVTVDTKFSFNTCFKTCSETVTINNAPTPAISGPPSVCLGENVVLDAGAGYNSYAWSGGGGSGQTATYNNVNTTTTYTVTVANANGCTGTDTHTVTAQSCLVEFSGKIIWEHDDASGVNNTTVKLTGSATGTDISDTNGDYSIATTLTNGSFTLKPTKNLNKFNAVNAGDVTAIQQHVTQATPITDPYKLVCADVNKSNSITTIDASLITQAILGNPQANAIFNTSWRFTPTTPVLNNPPWGFAEQRTYTNISGPQTNQDFFGMKIGDVAPDYASPANFGAGEPFVLRTQDRVLQAGENLEVDFNADQLDDLAAFQFALAFDPAQLQFQSVEPIGVLPVTADHFGTYNIASGEIRAVWSQPKGIRVEEATPVFRLRFKALQNGVRLSEALQLDDTEISASSFTTGLAKSKVELRFSEATGVIDPEALAALQFQVRPNPFREETTVSFSLPAAGEAQLRVLDVNGRELLRINNTYPAGQNSETLRLDGITASGVLTCELVTPFGVATRKMVLAR